jgi:alkanesulfonate monooxygenase SsuD/methylene tetrahydromethanopterin reductase-like flavin-dependent oxidoreductase (luciferase family)
MLKITMPHATAWNSWYRQTRNQPEGVRPLRAKVDAACAEVGRNPKEIERTVAVLVALDPDVDRRGGDPNDPPAVRGTPEEIAEILRAYAREGIGHVQLVIEPMTEKSLEQLAPVLENLDERG